MKTTIHELISSMLIGKIINEKQERWSYGKKNIIEISGIIVSVELDGNIDCYWLKLTLDNDHKILIGIDDIFDIEL